MKSSAVLIFCLPLCSLVLAESPRFGSVAPSDRVAIVSEGEMPGGEPPGLRASKKSLVKRDVDGVSFLGEDDGLIDGLERTVEAIGRVKGQIRSKGLDRSIRNEKLYGLVFDPSEIKLTLPMADFKEGDLIGAKPSGTFKNGLWTGITRFYRLEDGALVEIVETDLSAVRGRLYMVPESINTEINGKPAIAAVLKNAVGREIRQVVWVHGPKAFELRLLKPSLSKKGEGHKKNYDAISMARSLTH